MQTAESTPPPDTPELRDVTRRFWVALALTLPLVALELATHVMNVHLPIAQQTSNWLELTLGTPVVFWAGFPFFAKAAEAAKAKSVSPFQLTAVRTGVAWGYSVIGTAFPSLFPASLRAADGAVIVCFQAAAAITLLVLLGQMLEQRAKAKARSSGSCCTTPSALNRALCCA